MSRNARGKEPNWEPPKYREQSAFPSNVLLSRASAGHWDLRKQYEFPVTAKQKWTRRKKGLAGSWLDANRMLLQLNDIYLREE